MDLSIRRFLLRPVRVSEMTMIYCWRNEPRVRAVMPYTGEIDFEVHKRWWPKAIADPSRRMLILEDTGMPVAIVVFLETLPGISAKWGFYTAPRREISQDKSLTAWITCELAAISYAFEYLRLETLYSETIQTNTAVLWLHDGIGFETTGKKLQLNEGPPFIEKLFTRACYQKRRTESVFARLNALAIEPHPQESSASILA
jgi:hypothetical protein